MISIRQLNPEKDLAVVQAWWRLRSAPQLPGEILPRGWIASGAGVDLAASFLYLVEGKIGVIEWTTTNPRVAVGPDVVAAVKSLYEHLENVAWDAGCPVVISFVDPGSWEHRTMAKRGYAEAGGAHVMLMKPFGRKGGPA
jgi:hypothetical protein